MGLPEPERELVLMQLEHGCPALTPHLGASLAEAAAVCLESEGHDLRALLHVVSEGGDEAFALHRPEVTEQMKRGYNDADRATELGACAVAILLVRSLTGLTTIEQSRRGDGFDYWLGCDEELSFQARLEVSGVRTGDDAIVRSRINQKVKQTQRSDALQLPAYIVVVLFSRPMAQVVKR